MFSGSITILVFVAFFSSEASGSTTVLPPAPASTAVMTGSWETTMPMPTATSVPMTSWTTCPIGPSTYLLGTPRTCCHTTFIITDLPWKESYRDSSSEEYKELASKVSNALRRLFENYCDVKVLDVTFTNKDGQVQGKAKVCLTVKTFDDYIEDVFKTKVKSGKLDEMIDVMPDSAEFEAEGVTFKDWKAKECKICNDGGAGEFVIEGTCTPTENCKGLKNTKMSKDCEKYCSAASITVSFLILALGILLSFSFQ